MKDSTLILASQLINNVEFLMNSLSLSFFSSSLMAPVVMQWPGSYCDTKQSCCYPTTGKPAADFGIHGLWPNYQDGNYPQNCDSKNPFNPDKVLCTP